MKPSAAPLFNILTERNQENHTDTTQGLNHALENNFFCKVAFGMDKSPRIDITDML